MIQVVIRFLRRAYLYYVWCKSHNNQFDDTLLYRPFDSLAFQSCSGTFYSSCDNFLQCNILLELQFSSVHTQLLITPSMQEPSKYSFFVAIFIFLYGNKLLSFYTGKDVTMAPFCGASWIFWRFYDGISIPMEFIKRRFSKTGSWSNC